MPNSTTLFVGITSWNSAAFLGHALTAWQRHTAVPMHLAVWDNSSSDASATIAREAGAELLVRSCSQADAMNGLWRRATAKYVLLVHADVIVLSDRWFELCAAQLASRDAALVSPEDVGCGPFTRPFGIGMPESSFLFIDRERMATTEQWTWQGWRRLRLPRRALDLNGPHVTHRIPQRLAAAGLAWRPMEVQPSDTLDVVRYGPYPGAQIWSEELGRLRYGLGNFYSLDSTVTHYHNWYDRLATAESEPATRAPRRGFPAAFVRDYTAAFLADYAAGRLVVPSARLRDREPVAL